MPAASRRVVRITLPVNCHPAPAPYRCDSTGCTRPAQAAARKTRGMSWSCRDCSSRLMPVKALSSSSINPQASSRVRRALLRRPAIRLGASTAHQHCTFTVAQAVGLAEGLDGLLVVDDCEGASPVGTPQATFKTPRVEHAGERFPDVRERIRLPG